MRILNLCILIALLSAGVSTAQHDHAASPYASMEDRGIKALGAEEIAGLLEGTGMGMALPAELNGYPGPKHVLELAGELELTEEQRRAVQSAFDSMQGEARGLGAQIVDVERDLDRIFASGSITEDELGATLERVAGLRGKLRFVHLRAHLQVTRILSDEQRMQYRHLRGYETHH